MIPILFDENSTTFKTNGIGRLSDAISCVCTEERNGIYEVEMEYPITGIHFAEIAINSIIVVMPCDGGTLQPFRIYLISKPISGRVRINARHISYQLSNITVMPFSVIAAASACAETLTKLKENAVDDCPFTFSTDVTTGASYNQTAPRSLRSSLGGVDGSVLDQFGGEYEFDNYKVILHNRRGRINTGITLKYGKNITDIKQEENISSTVTGVVPYWIDMNGENLVTLPEKVIYSRYADSYPYKLTIPLDLSSNWEEKPSENSLRLAAQAYVNHSELGVPKVSIEVSFIALWQTEEYKDVAPLQRVQLCDEVSVDFEKLGINNVLAKVVKTEYNVLKERYDKITVGHLRSSLTSSIYEQNSETSQAITDASVRALRAAGVAAYDAINNATAWLTNANGYVVAVKDEDGNWKELLFMDSNDPAQAVNVIRINNNGIGFSTSGIAGPYTNAWTIDGNLVADFITTGILKDKRNTFVLDLDTGTLTLSDGTAVGDTTLGDMYTQIVANKNGLAAEIVDRTKADTGLQTNITANANGLAAEISARKTAVSDEAKARENGDSTLQTNIEVSAKEIRTEMAALDLGNKVYRGAYTPSTSNSPASGWNTTELKEKHENDVFIDTSTGNTYLWQNALQATAITFSASSYIADTGDYIRIYCWNGSDRYIYAQYNDLSCKRIVIPRYRSQIYILFHSDSDSDVGYGFSIENIEGAAIARDDIEKLFPYSSSSLPSYRESQTFTSKNTVISNCQTSHPYEASKDKLYIIDCSITVYTGWQWVLNNDINIAYSSLRQTANELSSEIIARTAGDTALLSTITQTADEIKTTVAKSEKNWDEEDYTITLYGLGEPKYTASSYSGKYYLDQTNGYLYYSNGSTWRKIKNLSPIITSLQSQITQNASSITSEVTARKDGDDALSSRITQNATNIDLKVSKGDVSSQLSLESGKITLATGRLIINSGNFKIDENGTITATSAVLSGSVGSAGLTASDSNGWVRIIGSKVEGGRGSVGSNATWVNFANTVNGNGRVVEMRGRAISLSMSQLWVTKSEGDTTVQQGYTGTVGSYYKVDVNGGKYAWNELTFVNGILVGSGYHAHEV